MPVIRTAKPTNTSHRWCDTAATAMIGRPRAVISGHHDPPGTWIGAGGVRGNGAMAPWCSVFHSGSRLSTRGITVKLYTGGGDGIAHSRVAPPQGSFPATSPRLRVHHRFTRNTSTATPSRNAPAVETWFKRVTPNSGP